MKKQNIQKENQQQQNQKTVDDVLQKSIKCSQGDTHLRKRNMFQDREDLIQEYNANKSWDLYSKAINELDQIRARSQNSK